LFWARRAPVAFKRIGRIGSRGRARPARKNSFGIMPSSGAGINPEMAAGKSALPFGPPLG
jgi:hypothetical protein